MTKRTYQRIQNLLADVYFALRDSKSLYSAGYNEGRLAGFISTLEDETGISKAEYKKEAKRQLARNKRAQKQLNKVYTILKSECK